jgi:hypothetical protein
VPLLLPKSIFFHIPKTGGSYVTNALKRAFTKSYKGVGSEKKHSLNLRREHTPPSGVDKDLKNGRFLFAFVRDPKTWYQSMWAYRSYGGWDNPLFVLDTECKADTFDEFVNKVLERFPDGVMSRMVKEFEEEMDFIGRQEHLTKDLIKALHLAGEDFEEHLILSTSPTNKMRPEYKDKIKYGWGTLKKLRKAEGWMYETFGY